MLFKVLNAADSRLADGGRRSGVQGPIFTSGLHMRNFEKIVSFVRFKSKFAAKSEII